MTQECVVSNKATALKCSARILGQYNGFSPVTQHFSNKEPAKNLPWHTYCNQTNIMNALLFRTSKYKCNTYWNSIRVFLSNFFSLSLPLFEWMFFFVLEFHAFKRTHTICMIIQTNMIYKIFRNDIDRTSELQHKTADYAYPLPCALEYSSKLSSLY